MGCLLSKDKDKDSEPEHNNGYGYRYAESSGQHNPRNNHEQVNHSRTPQPHQPEKQKQAASSHMIPLKPSSVSAPSPKPVIKQDTNTILGKGFEDVREFYTLGKEL
ncbi:hypothetical protein RYX36_016486, partial [Vicia faba]